MSNAYHDHQCVVTKRIPLYGIDAIRHGPVIKTIVISSSNFAILNSSSVQSSFLLFHCPCLTLMRVSGCDQLPILHNCHNSFPAIQTHRPLSDQVSGPPYLRQSSSNASCASSMIPSTSHLSKLSRSVQLFIKSIRNTTISIHIDSTSSISDLKHLIYAHDGIPPCDLRLMLRGHQLRDDALLSGLDVDGTTITCLLRVLGGNPYGRIPLYWWFGFSRSYEDGRAGEEGRSCHVLSEFEFEGASPPPRNWYSDLTLSSWFGVHLHSDVGMTGISFINLSSFHVISLPDSIGDLKCLTLLYLDDNQLTRLPDSIGDLTSLTHLGLGANQLTLVPDSIGNFVSLIRLDIHNNKLLHLPDSIGHLSSLTHLQVSGNILISLPDSICSLASLTTLCVDNNALSQIPDCIGSLTSLKRLNVNNNLLSFLPESIGHLASLTKLYANSNKLLCIPYCTGNLTSLTSLEISYNKLTALPNSIGNLTTLKYLTVAHNPITSTDLGKDEVNRRFGRDRLKIS